MGDTMLKIILWCMSTTSIDTHNGRVEFILLYMLAYAFTVPITFLTHTDNHHDAIVGQQCTMVQCTVLLPGLSV
jgi:hypothetical protein